MMAVLELLVNRLPHCFSKIYWILHTSPIDLTSLVDISGFISKPLFFGIIYPLHQHPNFWLPWLCSSFWYMVEWVSPKYYSKVSGFFTVVYKFYVKIIDFYENYSWNFYESCIEFTSVLCKTVIFIVLILIS